MRTHLGLIALSLTSISVATLTAAQNSDPYKNVSAAYVSADGQHTAVCTKEGDQHRVIVDGTIYGPYDDIDCQFSSPLGRSRSIWAFRGMVAKQCRLVVNGISYGPYDEVWPPAAAGQSWGALVKQGAKYHVLVDGTLSAGFDEIAGDHRLESEFSLNTVPIDAPLFFGRGDWAALGRSGSDLFIVTKGQTYGPFQALGDERFSVAAGDQFATELVNYLSFDRSTLAIPVSRKDAGGATVHYAWISGTEHGPADLLPEFVAVGKNMSMDGRQWAFFDQAAIYTSAGKISRPMPRDALVSDNGRTTMYSYGPDDNMRFVVNGREYGPFKSVGGFSCSPDGLRWVANYFSLDENKHFVLTESGRFGPYDDTTTSDGITFALGGRFLGNDWVWVGRLPDGKLSFLINGKAYGPYKSVSTPLSTLARTKDKLWAGYANRGDRVDIFSTGKFLMSTAPFELLGLVHASESHWHVQGRRDSERVLIEDGRFTPLGPIKRILGEFHSENRAKAAIRAIDEHNQHVMIFSHKTYGPYAKLAGDAKFSLDGSQWAFSAPANDQYKVISNQGESPLYNEIRDTTVSAQGPAFVGIDASGQWWLHVGSERLGPFSGCGLTAAEGRLYAITISGGTVKVQSYWDSSGTTDYSNAYVNRARLLFGRRRCR